MANETTRASGIAVASGGTAGPAVEALSRARSLAEDFGIRIDAAVAKRTRAIASMLDASYPEMAFDADVSFGEGGSCVFALDTGTVAMEITVRRGEDGYAYYEEAPTGKYEAPELSFSEVFERLSGTTTH